MSIAKEKVENFLNEVELFFTENNVRDEFLLSAVNHSLNLLERQLRRGLFSGNYELSAKIRMLRKEVNAKIPPQPLPLSVKESQKEKERLMTEAIAFNAAMEDLDSQYYFHNKAAGTGFLSDRKRFAKSKSQSWHLMTRGLGFFQCVAGASQAVVGVAGGIASFETGVGPVLAAAFSTTGVDNAVAGCSAAWTGEYQKTKINDAFHYVGLNDAESDVAEMVATFGFLMGPALVEHVLNSSIDIFITHTYIAPGVKNYRHFRTIASMSKGKVLKSEMEVYHSVTSEGGAISTLKGVNPKFFNEENRFGEAFYIGEKAKTTLKELEFHDAIGTHTISYRFNYKSIKILDLTQRAIAKEWGYVRDKSEKYIVSRDLSVKASELGYNAIRYPSERGRGANIALLKKNDFSSLLTPTKVAPSLERPSVYSAKLNLKTSKARVSTLD